MAVPVGVIFSNQATGENLPAEKVTNEMLRVCHLRGGSGDTRVGYRAGFWLALVLFTLEPPAVAEEAIPESGKLLHLPLGLSKLLLQNFL